MPFSGQDGEDLVAMMREKTQWNPKKDLHAHLEDSLSQDVDMRWGNAWD